MSKNIQDADSLDSKIFEFQNKISYVDNIPSLPPIQGFVTQRLGEKGVFIRRGHHGIDIVAKEGEPVFASASGVVLFQSGHINMVI